LLLYLDTGDGMADEDVEKVFTEIYENNRWGRGRSKSGTGSTLDATGPLREGLIQLFDDLRISSLVDAPCGTGEWMITATKALNIYMGFDIVKGLIDEARSLPGLSCGHFFNVADIIKDILPKADAILCRDCLVHLPFDLAMAALSNFKASGSTYLLATTFPQHENSELTGWGGWRPINLERSPFNFPPPVRLLRDRAPREGDKWADKSVGVWRFDQIEAAPV
jgi:hypothetical protein